MLRLAFGIGGFRRDVGADDDPAALNYARGRLVVANTAARINGLIDCPTLGTDPTLLAADRATTRAMGMTGKLSLDGAQSTSINQELSPNRVDLEKAANTINQLGYHGERVTIGSDPPKLARARRIQQLAKVFAS